MNTAQLIQFQKPAKPKQEAGKNMYSDRFVQGHVMSSRLYRKEVWPFISDAARNVYAELENRINGHLKETDYVSYSQLQGDESLEGARIMSRPTVSKALQELIKRGVISVVSTGKKGMKSYCINEISLKDQFTNKTSVVSKPVHLVNRSSVVSKPLTGVATTHTIDTPIDTLDNKKKNLPVDNSKTEMFDASVKYHHDNQNLYSLRELANVYPVQSDLKAQAKAENSELIDDFIFAELKNFAQWATGKEKTTAQNWMNFWIYRIQKLKTSKSKSQTQKPVKPKSKGLTDSQIEFFASKLTDHHEFGSMYSQVGESRKAFVSRVSTKLRDPKNIPEWASYLHDVGFIGQVEDFS